MVGTVREWLPSVNCRFDILCIDKLYICRYWWVFGGAWLPANLQQQPRIIRMPLHWRISASRRWKNLQWYHMTFVQCTFLCNVNKRCFCLPVVDECAANVSCSQICAAINSEELCYCSIGYEIDSENCFGMSSFVHYWTHTLAYMFINFDAHTNLCSLLQA